MQPNIVNAANVIAPMSSLSALNNRRIPISGYRLNITTYEREAKEVVDENLMFRKVFPRNFFIKFFPAANKVDRERFELFTSLTSVTRDLNNKAKDMSDTHDERLTKYLTEITGVSLVQQRLDLTFSDCHKYVEEHVLYGYHLNKGWQSTFITYLKDEKLSVLNPETLFILFLLNFSLEETLELSVLPKSYLAGMLPRGLI